MCGIYGITSVDRKFIADYIEVCKHRGPDGSDIWNDDRVTLGHNLLSIMGKPSEARQPWITDKGNVVVYNGEIFNYYELLAKHNTFRPKTKCDTELLAWGLDNFGVDFLSQIDSMHGFAYYDVKAQTIILSRDHAGIKPVFYAEVKEGLVFGSEIRGMLDKVPNARTLDKMAHSIFHYASMCPLRNTFFTNIKKLLPGETIVYDIVKKKIITTHRENILSTRDVLFHPKEFKEQVFEAVKRCSIGDKKIGLFLSAGMDSSMISHELLQANGEVNSFTNSFYPDPNTKEEDYNSDSKLALKLATAAGYNHTPVQITPEIYQQYWNKSVLSLEQIIRSPSLPANIYTNKIMRDHNIKVTIAGDLGDELLCGYPRHRRFAADKKIKTWKDLCRYLVLGGKPAIKINKHNVPKEDVLDEFIKTFPDVMWDEEDKLNSFCALELVTVCPEDFLIRNDKFGMAYSMEGRYPLASKTFMKYCMGIPSTLKISKFNSLRFYDGKYQLKNLSRQSYKNFLPDFIINKTKTGWTAPMAYWMNQNNNLKDFYVKTTGKQMEHKLNQKAGKRASVDMLWATWLKMFDTKNY